MKKTFSLSLLAIFILGFAAGYFARTQKFASDTQSSAPQEVLAANKLQALTDREIAEYYELKNDLDKLNKADEILAKMMTIFLHDLGIRISRKTLDESSKAINKNPEDSAIGQLDPNTPQSLSQMQSPEKLSSANWTQAERLRHEIKNEKETADFLDQVKIPEFNEALKVAKSFSNRTGTLESLQGQFLGSAIVKQDEKFRTWSVDLFLNGNLDKGKFEGKAHIKMAENGKVFSNSGHGGKLDAFKEFGSESDAILIRASPTVYFQMYFLKGADSLIGNVYKRNSDDEPYVRIGTVQLKRGG